MGSTKGSVSLSGAKRLSILFTETVFFSIYPQLGHLFHSFEYSAIECCENVKPRQTGHRYNNSEIRCVRLDIHLIIPDCQRVKTDIIKV